MPQLTIDRYITNETDFIRYINVLSERQVSAVALDLEGDQGTIRYEYSVSIFQCFDGKEMIIIDVLQMGNSAALQNFLNDPSIIKIMFSCANDIFICQNVLQCSISPVRDIAVGQKLLNEPVNLSEYLNIDPKLKDTYQRANWLRRPIEKNLLNYAINDVADLFVIENALVARLNEANLYKTYCNESQKIVEKDYRINQMHHYKVKFPGYSKFSKSRRDAAAVVWILRELFGKFFDCPVGYIMSKKAMSAIVRTPEPLAIAFERELNRNRSYHKKIRMEMVESFLKKAVGITENRM